MQLQPLGRPFATRSTQLTAAPAGSSRHAGPSVCGSYGSLANEPPSYSCLCWRFVAHNRTGNALAMGF